MKSKTLLFVCCLLSFLPFTVLTSCHKGDEHVNTVPQALKDFYVYREGTWWTMRDSLTGRLDSFYVTRFDSSINQYAAGTYEDDFVNMREVNIDGQNPADSAFYGFHLSGSNVTFQYEDYLFDEDMYSDGFAITGPLKNFNISGRSYTQAIEHIEKFALRIGVNEFEPILYQNDFYYNHTDGIFKLRVNTKFRQFVWELVNAHIVR